MKNKKILVAAGILFVILLAVIVINWAEVSIFSVNRSLKVGEVIPDITGINNFGVTQSLAQFQGKFILLNFWAVWCEPCKEEMLILQDIFSTNQDQIVVIGVDQADPPEVLNQFLLDNKISFPIWLDKNGSIADNYLIKAFPTTLIIGPDRELLAIHIGELNRDVLQKYIGDLK